MELKDPKKMMEDLNASTQKIVEGINKNVKELKDSKSLKELTDNVQKDFAEIQDLTKKMQQDNMSEVCSKVLKKTEDLQEKIKKFHDFIENSVKESAEQVTPEESEEETIVEDASGEETNENNE